MGRSKQVRYDGERRGKRRNGTKGEGKERKEEKGRKQTRKAGIRK